MASEIINGPIFDEPVEKLFSRKGAKNAEKKLFNINWLTLRALRLGAKFLPFYEAVKIQMTKTVKAPGFCFEHSNICVLSPGHPTRRSGGTRFVASGCFGHDEAWPSISPREWTVSGSRDLRPALRRTLTSFDSAIKMIDSATENLLSI